MAKNKDIFWCGKMLLINTMKTPLISKSIFLDFLFCSKNTWFKVHREDLKHLFIPNEFNRSLMYQGQEVEKYARLLFPDGKTVPVQQEKAAEKTKLLLEDKVDIFQATFVIDGFVAKNDVLAYNEKTKNWDLFEVKANNAVKEDGGVRNHIDDLAFQASLLKRAGVPIGKLFVVILNKDYKRYGDIDIQELFKIEDRTEVVLNKLPQIEAQMEAAKEFLSREEEPKGNCDCIFKGRSQHCETFHISNPNIPEYSIHDLSRIGSNKETLKMLVEAEIFSIDDIPNHFEFSDIQFNQIQAHKTRKSIINKDEIKNALGGLEFPLYFFDYETFAPAIPAFNGFSPYKKIPFQFSLHILHEPDGELEHFEYLHEDFSDPSEKVAELLDKCIGPKGTVVVWNKTFEAGVNKEIAERVPRYKKQIERINNQLYDLMDIFRNQHYVHHEFEGSTSIKYVLPVVAPHLSYDKLIIKEGATASNEWWKMVGPTTPDREKKEIAQNLKIYCALDTQAMYEVWKHLYQLIR